MNDILFLVPTIMTQPEVEIAVVENISKQFPNCKVVFISNIEDEDFDKYEPLPNIKKEVSGKLYSISKALNVGLKHLTNENHICFLQSDVFVKPEVVISCKNIIEKEELNTGVVGIRPHSTFSSFNKLVGKVHDFEIYKVLWSDGLMMWSKKLYEDIGGFNEEYYGDRESQEYCYRAHDKGYSNYFLDVKISSGKWATHHSREFNRKTKYDSNDFLSIVKDTGDRFIETWSPWEQKQKHLFE